MLIAAAEMPQRREPWTQQQHILTQETEEAVLSSFPFTLSTGCICVQGRYSSCSGSITTAEARMMTCQRSGNVKKKRAGWNRTDKPSKRRGKHERNMMEGLSEGKAEERI